MGTRWSISSSFAVVSMYIGAAVMIVYAASDTYDIGNDATSDSARYTQMANVHLWHDMIKPFRFRLLVPWLASFVPQLGDDPNRALVIQFAAFNIVGMTLAAFGVFLIAQHFRFTPAQAAIGGAMVLLSYPVLRFGGAPMTDAAAYGALALAVLFALRRKLGWFAIAMLVGMLVKETTVFAAVIAALAVGGARDRVAIAVASLPGVAAYSSIRWLLIPTDDGYSYDAGSVLGHVTDLTQIGWLVTVLGQIGTAFGVLWILGAWGALVNRTTGLLPGRMLWTLPAIGAVSLVIGSNYGRVWFLAFPVVILFALHGLCSALQSVPAVPQTPLKERLRVE